METARPSTRAVNSGSGNRALVCGTKVKVKVLMCGCGADLVKVSGDETTRKVTSRLTTRLSACTTLPQTCRLIIARRGLSTFEVYYANVVKGLWVG